AQLRLTAGNSRFAPTELSTETFLEQARTYQDMNLFDSMGKMMVFVLFQMGSTHPMPVYRTKELEKWYLSGEFDQIVAGNYAKG
ncbi:hypothetical protein ACWTQY_27725, partial [Klebsiella pneumoniae]